MSRPFIWGIIRLCRWNIMGDMTKSKNADFQKMSIYVMNKSIWNQNSYTRFTLLSLKSYSSATFPLQRDITIISITLRTYSRDLCFHFHRFLRLQLTLTLPRDYLWQSQAMYVWVCRVDWYKLKHFLDFAK